MKKLNIFKIQILIIGKELTDFLKNFCGRFHGQKWASATSHFLTSACGKNSQKEPGEQSP